MKIIHLFLLTLCTTNIAMEFSLDSMADERYARENTGAPHNLSSTSTERKINHEHKEILTTILSASEQSAREAIGFQEEGERESLLFAALMDMRARFFNAAHTNRAARIYITRDVKGRIIQDEEEGGGNW